LKTTKKVIIQAKIIEICLIKVRKGKRDKEILARYLKEMKGSLNLRIVMIKMLRKKIIKRIITLNIISDTNFKYFGNLSKSIVNLFEILI
jgi:hypothetical protein